jgi:hypothetical protein
MAPHEAERCKIRSSAELASSRLKKDYEDAKIMVRGKVTLHLMFRVIAHLPINCYGSAV